MPPFPLIPSVPTGISFLVPGYRDPVDCAERGGRGWWYGNGIKCAVFSNLNGIYPRCGRNTSAEIHWAKLNQTSAEDSAPSSTEMKIRPVDF